MRSPMATRLRWADSNASPWTILIRFAVGLVVFFPEGIQKLVFPDVLGAGRFAKIGIPAPEIMGPFVGVAEPSSSWACLRDGRRSP
jgi:putative oxidoreductase